VPLICYLYVLYFALSGYKISGEPVEAAEVATVRA
jgi:fucose permease